MGKLTKPVTSDQPAAWQAALRQAAFDAVNEADIKAIFTNIVKKAKEGDPASVRIVCDYLLGGKPGPSVTVVNPVQINHQAAPVPAKEPAPASDGKPQPYDRFGPSTANGGPNYRQHLED